MKRRNDYFHRLPTALTLHIFSFLVYREKRKCLIISAPWFHDLSPQSDHVQKLELQFENELFLPEPKKRDKGFKIQSCSTEYILLNSHELIQIRDFKIVPDFLVDAPRSARFWHGSLTNNDEVIWQEGSFSRNLVARKNIFMSPIQFKMTLGNLYSNVFFCQNNENFFFWHEYGEKYIHFLPLSEFFNANFKSQGKLEMCVFFKRRMEVFGFKSSPSFFTVKCGSVNKIYEGFAYFLVYDLKNFQIVNVIDSRIFFPNASCIRSWHTNDLLLCLELNDAKTLLFLPLLSWKKNLIQTKQFDQKMESWCINGTSLFVSFRDHSIFHYQIRIF